MAYIDKNIACDLLAKKALEEQQVDECAELTTQECLSIVRAIPTADVVEVAKIKEAKAEIINRMNEFVAEWLNISADTVNYWGGKVESMDIAKRLVNSVLTDLIDGKPQKEV